MREHSHALVRDVLAPSHVQRSQPGRARRLYARKLKRHTHPRHKSLERLPPESFPRRGRRRAAYFPTPLFRRKDEALRKNKRSPREKRDEQPTEPSQTGCPRERRKREREYLFHQRRSAAGSCDGAQGRVVEFGAVRERERREPLAAQHERAQPDARQRRAAAGEHPLVFFKKRTSSVYFKSEEERKTVDFSRGAPVTRPDACSAVRLGQCRETAQSAASLT